MIFVYIILIFALISRITFKYDFLAPPRDNVSAEPSMSKLESYGDKYKDDSTPMPETEVLW